MPKSYVIRNALIVEALKSSSKIFEEENA